MDATKEINPETLLRENKELRERVVEQEKRLKQFGDDLQAALNQYETLFHEAPAGYAFIDSHCRIIKPSDSFCKLLEKSRFYIIGKEIFEYINPEYTQALKERISMALLLNTTQKPALVKVQNGSRPDFWAEIRFQAVPYEDRSERLLLLSVNDIDSIAQYQQKLKRSKARAQLLLDSTSDGVLLITPDGSIINSNKSFEKLSELKSPGNNNYSFYDYLINTEKPERRLRIEKMIESKRPYVVSETFSERNFDIRVHPFLDEKGNIEYAGVFVVDTTDKRRLESELKAREELVETEVKKRMGEVYSSYEELQKQVSQSEDAQKRLLESEEAMQKAYYSLAKREALLETVAAQLTEMLESDEIEEVIYRMMASVGEHVAAERVYLFKRAYDRTEEMNFYFIYEEWAAKGIRPLREYNEFARLYLSRDFIGWEEAFKAKEAVSGRLGDFDRSIRGIMEIANTKSLLILPVFMFDKLWGFVGFDNMRCEENWKIGENAALSIMADSIGAAFERRERIRQLNEQRALSDTMIENLPHAVYAKDTVNFKYVIWNKAAENLLGFPKETAIGRSNFELFPLNEATVFHRQDLETLNSEGVHLIMEEKLTNSAGEERIVRSIKLPIYDSKQKPVIILGISIDITETVNSERSLKLYAGELEKARQILETNSERLARSAAELEIAKVEAERASRVKSEFLANISHELRTPMNAILGFTEILQGMTKDEKILDYLSIISSSGKSLLALMNDILDLSKIETGRIDLHLQSTRFLPIAEEILRIFEGRAKEKNIELKIDVSADFPAEAFIDEVKLRQILFNLVGNAVKFTDKGFVCIRALKLDSPSAMDRSADLVIEVIDAGVGVGAEDKDRIFESFYQPPNQDKAKYGGAGLGLAITKKLVDKMNGSITVSDRPEGGSVFRVTLRNVALSNGDGASHPFIECDFSLGAGFEAAEIIIVSDTPADGEKLRSCFEKANLAVSLRADASEALGMLLDSKPGLILAEIETIRRSGFEPEKFAASAKSLCDAPIVAIGGPGPEACGDFDARLMKPFKRDDLIILLHRFLKLNDGRDVPSAEERADVE